MLFKELSPLLKTEVVLVILSDERSIPNKSYTTRERPDFECRTLLSLDKMAEKFGKYIIKQIETQVYQYKNTRFTYAIVYCNKPTNILKELGVPRIIEIPFNHNGAQLTFSIQADSTKED